MKIEYTDAYDDLFAQAYISLQKIMMVKLYSVTECDKVYN